MLLKKSSSLKATVASIWEGSPSSVPARLPAAAATIASSRSTTERAERSTRSSIPMPSQGFGSERRRWLRACGGDHGQRPAYPVPHRLSHENSWLTLQRYKRLRCGESGWLGALGTMWECQ